MRTTHRGLLAVFCLATAGCSFFTSFDEFTPVDASVDAGPTDMNVDAGPDVDTPLGFYLELSRRLCDLGRRCEAKFPSLRAYGQAYCLPEDTLLEVLPPDFREADASYRPSDAEQLLASLDAVRDSCALEVVFGNLSFVGLFRGTLASGEGCNDDRQCSSGYCTADYDSCGMCASRAALNGTCVDQDGCLPGTLCDVNGSQTCVAAPTNGMPCLDGVCSADSYCQTGTCVMRPGLHQACSRPNANPGSFDPCQGSLVCTRVGEAPEVWQCEAGGTVGEECENAVTPCGPGLRCVGGECVNPAGVDAPCAGDTCDLGLVCTGVSCQPPPTQGDTGCSASVQCLTGVCSQGACVMPTATFNTPCGFETPQLFSSGPGNYCSVGYCNDVSTCSQFRAGGASCSASKECGPTAYCAGTCTPRIAESGDCVGAEDGCAAGLRCISGQCAPPSDDGEPCGVSDDCLDGLVCVGPFGSAVCSDCRM
ncbi:MAG: hypothetical protein R3B40_31610 [Polyangiales bacterium]